MLGLNLHLSLLQSKLGSKLEGKVLTRHEFMFGVKLTPNTEAGVRFTLNTLLVTLNTKHELNHSRLSLRNNPHPKVNYTPSSSYFVFYAHFHTVLTVFEHRS